MSLLDRVVFDAGNLSRTMWYGAQYAFAQRLAPPLEGPVPAPGSMPDWPVILRDLRALYKTDWANVRAGYYPSPAKRGLNAREMMRDAARFLKDVPAVNLRRRLDANSEVFDDVTKGTRPRYYLQNFHYQTDGWLSESSAALYDHQVEVLFTGGADAMRRQALVPIGDWLKTRAAKSQTLLDVACGTGRFLSDVTRAHPTLNLVGLDMSESYLSKARRTLAKTGASIDVILGKAETLPIRDGQGPSLITSVFLFHELPRKIRHAAVRELARVLAPGGRLVLVDSIVIGDYAAYDSLLDRFPVAFHEPYYSDYIRDRLEPIAVSAGLRHTDTKRAFFSRIMTFDKPL